MICRHLAIVISAACLALAFGCGTEEKPPTTGGDYFPLTVGNWWLYTESDNDPDTDWASRPVRHEVVDYEEKDFEHDAEGALPVFVVANTFPDAAGDDDPRIEYVLDDGTRVLRKRQEVYETEVFVGEPKKVRDYEPGLLRFDRSRNTVGDNWAEYYTTYTVSIPPDLDPIEGDGEHQVDYVFEILEPETVTVPAGTFDCTVLMRQITVGNRVEEKIYYFAPGVGKVKEATTTGSSNESIYKVEELDEYYVVPAADGGV